MNDSKTDDPNIKTRSKLKIIGIVFLVIGIPLVITGAILLGYQFMNFFSLSIEEASQLGFMSIAFLGGGLFLVFIGIFALIMAHRRQITRYMVEETGMALGGVSDQSLDGYGKVISKGTEAMASGIQQAGGLKINVETDEKTIIKIKCRECGTLNDEDAKFCDECGTSF